MNWQEFTQENVPQERRCVLLQTEGVEGKGRPPSVVVGYARQFSNGWTFIIPGIGAYNGIVTHWSDCLGDNFNCPLWANKEMNAR